jgi:hypothetical protein
MIFDFTQWGTLPQPEPGKLASALGLGGLELLADSVPNLHIFPRTPEYSYLIVRLDHFDSHHWLACFDEQIMQRAFWLGLFTSIDSDPTSNEVFALDQLRTGQFVIEPFKIVRRDTIEPGQDDSTWFKPIYEWDIMPRNGQRRESINRYLSFDADDEERYATDHYVVIYPRSPEHNHVRFIDEFTEVEYACFDRRTIRRAIKAGFDTRIESWFMTALPLEIHTDH